MYLSGPRTRQLSSIAALLAQPLEGSMLREQLLEPVAELLRADYVASFVWNPARRMYTGGLCTRGDASLLSRYEQQDQFDDPLPALLHPRGAPARTTEVLGQDALVQTDFFQRFLRSEQLYWGLNLFARNGGRDVGDLRIWRRRAHGNFDSDEVEMLRLLYPALSVALGRGEPDCRPVNRIEPATPGSLAVRFAHLHGLSSRESDVAALAACGAADKLIARELGIGFATVRTHLTNGLRKLGCADRRALIRYAASLSSPVVDH